MTESDPRKIWQRKLDFLLREEAKATGTEKFKVAEEIEEARSKLAELGCLEESGVLPLSDQEARKRLTKEATRVLDRNKEIVELIRRARGDANIGAADIANEVFTADVPVKPLLQLISRFKPGELTQGVRDTLGSLRDIAVALSLPDREHDEIRKRIGDGETIIYVPTSDEFLVKSHLGRVRGIAVKQPGETAKAPIVASRVQEKIIDFLDGNAPAECPEGGMDGETYKVNFVQSMAQFMGIPFNPKDTNSPPEHVKNIRECLETLKLMTVHVYVPLTEAREISVFEDLKRDFKLLDFIQLPPVHAEPSHYVQLAFAIKCLSGQLRSNTPKTT